MRNGIEQWRTEPPDAITAKLARESRRANWLLGLIAFFSVLVIGGLMAQLNGF